MFKYKKFEATTTLPRTLGFWRSNLVTFKMQCSQRMAEMHPQHKKFDVKITKSDNQPNLPGYETTLHSPYPYFVTTAL